MGIAKRAQEERLARGYDLIEGGLCLDHIQDAALVQRLAGLEGPNECRICGRFDEAEQPSIVEFDALMEVIFEAIHHFYQEDSGFDVMWDSEDSVSLVPHLDAADILESLTDVAFAEPYEGKVVQVLLDAMPPDAFWTPWDSEANDIDSFEWRWDNYAELAKFQSRVPLETSDPADPPSRLLRYLEMVREYANESLELVRDLDSGTRLFRGRLCEDPLKFDLTAKDLGPAPRERAAANRMSHAGVSYFYGSTEPETAVAEIAGHGVEPLALVGEFVTTRSLRILDFTASPAVPSPFDLDRRIEAMMGRFLAVFVEKISVPVIPDGRQHIEYAPTQLLTEYLRWRSATRIDGIAWPSATSRHGHSKTNYVLFIGPSDCATLGGPVTEPDAVNDFLLDLDPPRLPTLELDPARVNLWEVQRTVDASLAPSWRQPTRKRIDSP